MQEARLFTLLSASGEFLGKWGERGEGEGQLNRPSGIAFDADENLYVVDTSFFVSIGAVNPSLTAIANAIRVGDHLLQRLA